MNNLYAIIIGLIHGLCGILPVSEVGHLQILKKFTALGGMEAATEAILPLAALLAIVLVFHKTVLQIGAGIGSMVGGLFSGRFKWRKASKYQIMAVYLLPATVCMGLVAFIRQYFGMTESLLLAGAMMLVTAGLLFIGTHSLCHNWTMLDMKLSHAFKLGLFQAAAVFLPGLSRSGTTYSMGMNMGFEKETAMEFSFMLSIPALLISFFMKADSLANLQVVPALLGAAAALVGGIAACVLFRLLVQKEKMGIFMYYMLAAGVAAIVLNFI